MRRQVNKLLFAILALVVVAGCTEYPEDSKATFWPVIELIGDEFVIIEAGDEYEEQGANVTENGVEIPYDINSEVDSETPGAYYVSYSATNVDGISASKTRLVLVVDPETSTDANLTGSFTRVGQAGTVINWRQDEDKPFTYVVNNVGGVPPSNASYGAFNVNFFAYNVAPGTVVVPLQQVGVLAPFFCSASLGGSRLINFNEFASPGDVGYAWVVNGANFGTGLRTFRKL